MRGWNYLMSGVRQHYFMEATVPSLGGRSLCERWEIHPGLAKFNTQGPHPDLDLCEDCLRKLDAHLSSAPASGPALQPLS